MRIAHRGMAAIAVTVLALTCGCGATEAQTFKPATASVPRLFPPGVTERPPASDEEVAGSCAPRASYRPASGPNGPTLSRIRQRGLLRVGGQQTYCLLSYRDAVTGQMSGFEVELARRIATALLGDPDKIQFVSLSPPEREPAVEQGRADIVLASMTMTCERWNRVAFSSEYLTSGQRVLVPRRSSVASIDDLGGKKVCASVGGTNLTEIARARSRPIPVGATNATDCLVLLQQGQVDAVSTSDVILAGLAAQDRNTHIVGPRFADVPIGAAMHRDATDLVRFVNGVLEELRTSGGWSRLYQDSLARALEPAQAPAPVYRD